MNNDEVEILLVGTTLERGLPSVLKNNLANRLVQENGAEALDYILRKDPTQESKHYAENLLDLKMPKATA
jgi:hypothetical protein